MSGHTILILAAGRARRMRGVDKLMLPVDGVPLLRRQARVALQSGARVVVALPARSVTRRRALAGLPVRLVPVRDTRAAMAQSLRAGIAALPAASQGVTILLADMPDITPTGLRRLRAAHKAAPHSIVQATDSAGRPGHPVVFPASLFGALQSVTGDRGGRAVIAAHRDLLQSVRLPGQSAIRDLDTRADWAGWAARRGRKRSCTPKKKARRPESRLAHA